MNTMEMPIVSVVLATKNEEANITNCLSSINKQSCPSSQIELIVVDNNSSDKTVDLAKNFTSKVFTNVAGRANQVNLGISEAKGKYVLFPDADMIISERVIAECVSKCEIDNCIGMYIPEIIIGVGYWIAVRNFERSFYNASCIDAIRFCRRDKFLEIGGFDTDNLSFGMDDWDFDRRIRQTGNVNIIESPLYHNEGKFSISNYLAKKRYYSESVDKYILKWGKKDPIVKKQLGASYRLFGVFVENGKWKILLRHPILVFGMYFLRLLVAVTYLRAKK